MCHRPPPGRRGRAALCRGVTPPAVYVCALAVPASFAPSHQDIKDPNFGSKLSTALKNNTAKGLLVKVKSSYKLGEELKAKKVGAGGASRRAFFLCVPQTSSKNVYDWPSSATPCAPGRPPGASPPSAAGCLHARTTQFGLAGRACAPEKAAPLTLLLRVASHPPSSATHCQTKQLVPTKHPSPAPRPTPRQPAAKKPKAQEKKKAGAKPKQAEEKPKKVADKPKKKAAAAPAKKAAAPKKAAAAKPKAAPAKKAKAAPAKKKTPTKKAAAPKKK